MNQLVHSVHYNLFDSVNLSFDKIRYLAVFDCSTEKTFTNTCNVIHAMKTCRQASVGRGFDSHRGQKIFSLPRVAPCFPLLGLIHGFK